MNDREKLYQTLAKYVRKAHNQGSTEKWPGKPLNAPAVSRYPNVLAELAENGWPNIDVAAEFANVSPEIIAAVVEDDEELSNSEIAGLARHYGCSPSYLAAPTLQVIDISTHKGKRRLWEMETLLAQAGEFMERRLCEGCADALRNGHLITYAQWKVCCGFIKDELERRQRTGLKHRVCRTKRYT